MIPGDPTTGIKVSMQTKSTAIMSSVAAYVEAAIEARADQGLPRAVEDCRALDEVHNALQPSGAGQHVA